MRRSRSYWRVRAYIALAALVLVCAALLFAHGGEPVRETGSGDPQTEQPGGRAGAEPVSQKAVIAARRHDVAIKRLDVSSGAGVARQTLRAKLPARYTEPVTIDVGVARVLVRPLAASAVRKEVVDGKSVYRNAYPGIDVVHEPNSGSLKESLIVHAPLSRDVRFELRGGATPFLRGDGSIGFRIGAQTIGLRSPAPVAVDHAGKRLTSGVARYRLQGRILTLRLALPSTASYPVVVDPTFDMGQLASNTIATRSFNDPNAYMGRDTYGFNETWSVAAGGGKLLVGDYWSKVNVFDPMPAGNGADRTTKWTSSIMPRGLWTDGTKSLVTDQVGHRVWVHDSFSSGPSFVLGQSNFSTYERNDGGRSASSLATPLKVWSDGNRIAVADYNNNRVLIWNSWPTANKPDADVVLGQADFTSGACNRDGARAANTLCLPFGVWSDGTRFFVADTSNHRVLGWNSFPTSNGQAADFVLGQGSFGAGGCNSGAVSKAELCGPHAVSGTASQLFVADTYNHRVLVWNSIPSATAAAADVEVGEKGVAGTSQSRLSGPQDVVAAGSKLVVADSGNNRALIWNTIPAADSALADQVLGHTDFVHGGEIDNHGDTLLDPQGLDFDESGGLWVSSAHDAMTLRFPAALPTHGAVADYAPGSNPPGEPVVWDPNNAQVCWPNHDVQASDDGHLFQSNGHRVTWRNTLPSTYPTPVFDGVVGATSISSCGGGAASATTLHDPMGSDFDGTKLAVADHGNNRVLIWNTLPTVPGAPADVVLGQSDFSSSQPNTGGISATTLSAPQDVRIHDGKLFVADTGNHRVLVWNTIPTSNAAPADVVLGQSSMLTGSGGLGPASLEHPVALDVDEHVLVVSDSYNHRVLLWDSIPTVNGTAADRALGQVGLSSEACAKTQSGLCNPNGVTLRDGRLAVITNYSRVVVYEDVQGPALSGISDVVAGTRATVSWVSDEDASSEIMWDTVSHPTEVGYANSTTAPGMRRAHALVAQPLTSGTTYYYRVRSVDARGNATVSPERTLTAENITRLQAAPAFVADASISSAGPMRNYGGAPELRVGGSAGDLWRSLLRFDLAQLPAGATVTSATLQLTQTDAGSGGTPSIEAHRVATPFVEGLGNATIETEGATWESPDGIDPWATFGGDTTGGAAGAAPAPALVGGALSLDVTSMVAAWAAGAPNDGLLLRTAVEPAGETKGFASAEHADPAQRPVLVLRWQGSDTTNPQIARVRVEMLSSSSARVTWDTDEATSTVLDYGQTVTYGSTVRDEAAVNRHTVTLNDLTPNTQYHFRVSGSDSQGNTELSADRVFRTSYRVEIMAGDAFVRADMPTRNAGAQPSLFVGNASSSWQTARSLLRFDTAAVPPGASIRSATMKLALSGQADGSQPMLSVHRLQAPFVPGSGNPLVGPDVVASSGVTYDAPEPLLMPAERHVALTQGGWWQIVPRPNIWESTYLYGRRNYDGTKFGGDTLVSLDHGWGKEGTATHLDGDTMWIAGLHDGTPTMSVRSYRASTGAQLTRHSLNLPPGATAAPGLAMASDGRLWVKAEDPSTGAIHVARSSLARDASNWEASTVLATQAAPGHAQLVPLSAGRMLALSQDGSSISSFEWDGTSWLGPTLVANDATLPATWRSDMTFAAVAVSGDAWLSYLSAGNVHALRYSASAWSAPATLDTGATSVAISADAGSGEPHVFWQVGTALRSSRFNAAWTPPAALAVTLPATATQLSASPPSDEALAITWVSTSGSTRTIKWFGYALPKPADGVTWATSGGTAPWSSAGGDFDAVPLATQAAPNVPGATTSFDLTLQTQRWHEGLDPSDGVLLRKQVEDTSLADWKAFYGNESANAQLRPRLIVDYDLASVGFSEPTSATAWKASSTQEVSWQTTGSGMTKVDLFASRDAGATWTPIVADAPNAEYYNWITPATQGPIRLRIDAKNSIGVVIASTESDDFVIDDTAPDPVTDLAAPSPSNAPALTWTQPGDGGGAGMARGTYRVYRSTTLGVLGSRIATVSPTSHTDNAPLAEGTYYYTVLPVDGAGNIQPAGNNQIAVAVDRTQPNPVTDLAGPALTRVPVALTWSAVADNGSAGMGTYRVYRSTSAGPLGSQLQTVSVTSASDTPPLDGTYHYTVVPVDNAGNAKLAGNNQVAVTYDSTPPSGASVTLDAGASWTWDTGVTAALSGGDALEYQISEDNTFASSSWVPIAASATFTLGTVEGSHVVYARFRDAAGNISATANDSITLDSVAPDVPSRVDDGSGADRDYTSSTTTLWANWPSATDTTSGIQRYEYCIGTESDASGCSGTVLVGFTSTGLATSASASGLTLTPGASYTTCVRTFDNAGHQAASVRCSDAITVMSLTGVSPATGAQGRQGLTVQLTGTGFAPDAEASFSGTGITVVSSTRISVTRLDAVINIAAAAPLAIGDITINNGEGSSTTSTGVFTVEASNVNVSMAGCVPASLDFDDVDVNSNNVTTSDCTVEFGSNNNTAELTIHQQDGTGTAMTGPGPIADYDPGTSDWAVGDNTFGACLHAVGAGTATDATTWSTTGSCTDTDDDPWNPIPPTAVTIATTAVAGTTNARASVRFGWRLSPMQMAGTYTSVVTFTVIPSGV